METKSGWFAFHHWLLLYNPVEEGRFPRKNAFLEGQHTVAAACALVKDIPRSANRSMLGVWTVPPYPPRKPVQSFKSSTHISSTFGEGLRSPDIHPGRTGNKRKMKNTSQDLA
jgi:hypothetical protein